MLKLSNLETIGRPVYNFHNLHSVDFDGVDDFIQLGEPISYTQHTISTWVKVSDSDASKTIIDARDANDDGIRIFLTSAEVVTYQLNTSDITSGSAISVDEWHHIVATYDGTTQKLYIDGSLVSSATTSQTISTTTNAKIGSRNFSDRANEFLGKIDELAIFDRALTAEEVTAIFRIKYGANLVLNGTLDELGSELVTNGDFSNGLTGFVTENVELAEGGVRIQSDGSSGSFIKQSGILTLNKTYKLVFDVTQVQQTGSLRVGFSSLGVSNITTTGTYTIYFVANGSEFQFVRNSAINVIVDNVSVKQVDPNGRWTLNTGWSYGDGIASCDGSQTSTSNFVQADTFDNNLTDTYKLSFDLVVTQGSVTASSGSMSQSFTTSGFKSFIGSPATGAGNLNFTAGSTFIGSVTNVMVEKQKYVATNLKLKSTLFNPFTGSTLNLKNYYRFGDGILDFFMSQTGSSSTTLTDGIICDMVEPSLGSELVLNGNFATESNWSTGSGWTIDTANNRAVRDNQQTGNSQIAQTIAVEQDKIYRLEYTREYLSGTGQTNLFSDFIEDNVTTTRGRFVNTETNKLFTVVTYFQPQYTGNFILQVYGIGTFSGIITNVSMKEVNGVAGLMTNMSEADITNDVPG